MTFIQAFRLPSDPIYHCTLFCILCYQEIHKYCLNQTGKHPSRKNDQVHKIVILSKCCCYFFFINLLHANVHCMLCIYCISQLIHVMTKHDFAICEQQRRRSVCAFAQFDQHLCCSLFGYLYLLNPKFQDSSLSLCS